MDRERLYGPLGVFSVFILALFLRLLPMRISLQDGSVLFYAFDSYYHMRRILYTVDHFPETLWFDSYLNYPHGLALTWPPLFDQIVAGVSIALGAHSQYGVEMVGAIMPPILGSITVVALYYLVKEIFGNQIALLSAFLLAIAPVHIYKSQFGITDHHVLEVLFVVGILLFLVLAISRDDRRYWFAVIAGILIASLAFTWRGTPAYLGLIIIFFIAQLAIDIRDGVSSKDIAGLLFSSFGLAFILLLPFWNSPWLTPSFYSIAGILVIIPLLYALSIIFLKREIPWAIYPLIIVVSGFIFDHLVRQIPAIYSPLRSGAHFIFSGEMVGKISEAEPLYVSLDLFTWFGFTLILSIIGLLVLMIRMWDDYDRTKLLFLVWTIFVFALAVAQIRFLYLFSVNMAILISILFFQTSDQMARSGWFEKSTAVKIVPIVLLAIFVLPSVADIDYLVKERPEIAGDWYESLRWLEENSPVTSGFVDPEKTPEYSVFCWWDYGNWVLYESKRPVVANNFQAGAVESATFYLSEKEEDATNILDSRGSRYVITDAGMLYGKLAALAAWLNEDVSTYQAIESQGSIVSIRPLKKFMETTLAGLHLFDCNGMGHLRLVYESSSFVGSNPETSMVKIFEYVPGAVIYGTIPPDQPVGVLLDMTSNQGRRFTYFNYCAPNVGRYEIRVPYSTEAIYKTHATNPYQIIVGDEVQHIEVSEDDVLSGNLIEVNF
jgi:oligosaccharyl transferase (archaeosortase A-associated)